MCGEKYHRGGMAAAQRGSPPRVRGKAAGMYRPCGENGITPACAGKRSTPIFPVMDNWDHPRVCGEKLPAIFVPVRCLGSPPRVRGKAITFIDDYMVKRITPACAGKRVAIESRSACVQDHPRVCGEKVSSTSPMKCLKGSPPRVRGKEGFCYFFCRYSGITPACAGKRG